MLPWPLRRPTYNRSMPTPDVCVRGSGAVAHVAALVLARQGLQVVLQRRAARGAGEDVRAYALNAASVALLERLQVWATLPADARTPVYDMHVEGDAQGAAIDFSAWQQGVDALAWIVDTPALEQALHQAAGEASNLHCVEVDDGADGADTPAALQLLCEGRDSAARTRLGVAMPLHPYDQHALAARLVATQDHAGLARQWFRAPDVLALLPLDRPQPGCSYALVWSLPQERAAELMLLRAEAFESALFDASGGAVGPLRLASERAQWPLALARAERVCGPGWALLGDAAHLVHPLAGQGLNLGLADVAALADVIAARESWRGLGELRLLQRYARRRALPTLAMGQLTDGLLHLFASRQPLVRELRNRGLTLVNGVPVLKRALTARALDA